MIPIRAFSFLALLSAASAWVLRVPPGTMGNRGPATPPTGRSMAINYNDPQVAEEFAKVQPMPFEEVESELRAKGIPVPTTMNEMDVKLMLVEMRLRFSGKLEGQTEKKRPTKFTSKFEEALWTKPAFKEYYEHLKAQGDHNAMNVATEYLSDKVLATTRYGKDYKGVIRKIEAALTAPPPVNSTTLKFSGFPANMGTAACKMTLEAIGPLVEFDCKMSDELPILVGQVTFEDIEAAKKAVAQYNGMNMGMGNVLEIVSV
jgi:hypothetical protein